MTYIVLKAPLNSNQPTLQFSGKIYGRERVINDKLFLVDNHSLVIYHLNTSSFSLDPVFSILYCKKIETVLLIEECRK